MKKLFGIIAALFVTASAFADGYKGDFQLNFGAGFESMTAEKSVAYGKGTMGIDTGLFMLNLETWHVFGSSDVFKFGFMAALNEGLGGTTKWEVNDPVNGKFVANDEDRFLSYKFELFLAPAFSFFIGDTVRFNVAPGLSILFADAGSFMYEGLYGQEASILGISAVGPGIEIQAKFCPNAHVSPVIGYRFTANFTDSITSTSTEDSSISTKTCDSVVLLSNTFTLGISWNW